MDAPLTPSLDTITLPYYELVYEEHLSSAKELQREQAFADTIQAVVDFNCYVLGHAIRDVLLIYNLNMKMMFVALTQLIDTNNFHTDNVKSGLYIFVRTTSTSLYYCEQSVYYP